VSAAAVKPHISRQKGERPHVQHKNLRGAFTPEEAKSGLTIREISAARRARKVIEALETPSEQVARAIILRHSVDFHDHPLLPKDVSNAYKLYGRENEAAGKTVDRPAAMLDSDKEPFKEHTEREQNLYCDLLFVDGYTFLFSVSAPLYRTMIDQLPSKEFKHVTAALQIHVQRYNVRGINTKKVVFDGESALQDSDRVEAIIGIPFVQLPPKQHVSIVERRIRVLKERARAALDRIQFDLPRSLIPALLNAIVHRLNGEPISQHCDPYTSNEIWDGRKTNLALECDHAFGDYVTCTAPLTIKNTMESRVEKAIVLSPCEGGYWTLCLQTWARVSRKQNGIKHQPIPHDIKELLNQRAGDERAAHDKEVATKKRKNNANPRGLTNGLDSWIDGTNTEGTNTSAMPPSQMYFTETMLVEEGIGTPARDKAHHVDRRDLSSDDGGVTPLMVTGHAEARQQTGNKPAAGEESAALRTGQRHQDDSSQGATHASGIQQAVGQDVEDDVRTSGLHPTAESTSLRTSAPTTATATEEIKTGPPPVPASTIPSTSRPMRRALTKKMEREAESLLRKLMRNIDDKSIPSQKAPRASGRKRKPGWKVHNMRPEEASRLHGEREAANAMADEIAQIVDEKVFEPVYKHLLNAEQRRKIIKSKMFLKAKLDSAGTFIKLKARLVARGDMEDKNTFDSLYSPTGSMESAFAILGIAAFEKRKIKVIDLVAAFLTVDVVKGSETYVNFDPYLTRLLIARFPEYKKFVAQDGTFCGKLDKSLYGLCQSSANLHAALRKTLMEKMGFTNNPKDPCVYNRTQDGKQITVLVYVDDLLVTGADTVELEAFTTEFKRHHPKVTEKTGVQLDYLGMLLDTSVIGEIAVIMQGYTERAADTWKAMYERASKAMPNEISAQALRVGYKAPCDSGLFEIDEESMTLPAKQQDDFHSMVATMLYMAKRARPDLLCTTAYLTTRVQKATVQDWGKLRRLMSYSSDTASRALVLRPKGIYVEAYSDASFATHQDRKSQTGTVCTIGGAPYYCSSSRQKTNAKSAAESEMIAISDACTMIQWGQQFIYHQGYVNSPPAQIWEDNQATIFNLKRGAPTAPNSRHYEVRYFYLADLERRGIVRVEYLKTDEMTADLLTKGVSGEVFEKLSFKLMNSVSDDHNQRPHKRRKVDFDIDQRK